MTQFRNDETVRPSSLATDITNLPLDFTSCTVLALNSSVKSRVSESFI